MLTCYVYIFYRTLHSYVLFYYGTAPNNETRMTTDQTVEILIVEDEPQLRELYGAMLDPRYEVGTAADGDQALAAVSERTDVVLLDRRLPEYSGEEILTAIRDRGLDCQIVFCSAVVPDVDIVPIEPDGYLHKPITSDDLADAVERQLQRAGYPPEVKEYLRLETLRTTLEAARSPSELEGDSRYQKLLDRIDRKARSERVAQSEYVSAL